MPMSSINDTFLPDKFIGLIGAVGRRVLGAILKIAAAARRLL